MLAFWPGTLPHQMVAVIAKAASKHRRGILSRASVDRLDGEAIVQDDTEEGGQSLGRQAKSTFELSVTLSDSFVARGE